MDDKNAVLNLEEVFDSEMDDLWDILFPYASEKKAKNEKMGLTDSKVKQKPTRYMNFLSM